MFHETTTVAQYTIGFHGQLVVGAGGSRTRWHHHGLVQRRRRLHFVRPVHGTLRRREPQTQVHRLPPLVLQNLYPGESRPDTTVSAPLISEPSTSIEFQRTDGPPATSVPRLVFIFGCYRISVSKREFCSLSSVTSFRNGDT